MSASAPNSCNVLTLESERRKLWRFGVSGDKVALAAENSGTPDGPLPAKLVAKDWTHLWSRKFNLAWLPLDQIFLRVVELPKCEPAELPAMVEFQLEKISPLPVAQIAWSAEVIPPKNADPRETQTVAIVIIARGLVEDFLGKLEGKGYLADQLGIPLLDQLLATRVEGDGAWVYLQPFQSKTLALVAWWYGGVLRNLALVQLSSPENFAREVGEQLTKTAWAGELENWLTSEPVWHLVADANLAAAWHGAMNKWAGRSVELLTPLTESELAKCSAERAARQDGAANLMPAEFIARYRQRFVDRLWMRSLGVVLALYIGGVLIYFGALQVLNLQLKRLENQVAELSEDFTKTQQLKARTLIVVDQINLRFAALDAWRAIAEKMPEELTLQSFAFSRGRSLNLNGISSDASKVTDYSEALGRLMGKDQPLFARVELRNVRTGPGALGAETTSWAIECELSRLTTND
ncbi:MAG: hypothetical protein HZA89_10920 [Verrucomicrobia bacterium]|nr:hypothetical protein [Verrucomicrobiota bacterium]